MAELMDVLDFILNRCTVREIDALDEAVKRRRRDLEAACGTGSLDPAKIASNMSAMVSDSIDKSISGMQESFRDFAWDMIRKEAPELTEEQTEAVVQQMIPDMASLRRKNGKAAKTDLRGLPPAAMQEMVYQFTAYSTGSLKAEDEAALRGSVGSEWPRTYWNLFPEEVRSVIKSFIEDNLDPEVFQAAIAVLLS